MGGRYDDVRRAKSHRIAAFHHKIKAATYSQLGLGKKAESHRRRAKWHAAFGNPPEEEAAKAFHAQFIPHIRQKFERASAEIQSIADLTKEVANYNNEAAMGGASAKAVKEIRRVPYDAARAETKVKAAAKSVREFAKSFRRYIDALKASDKTNGRPFYTEYDDVGKMIDSLIRFWLKAIEKIVEISKGDLAYTDMDEIIGLLKKTSIRGDTNIASVARVPPEILQINVMIRDSFAAGAATLLGVKRAHSNNYDSVRTKDPVPDDKFELFPDGVDFG
jgi:hypothetical protein